MPYIDEPVGRVKLQTTRYLLFSSFFVLSVSAYFSQGGKSEVEREAWRVQPTG